MSTATIPLEKHEAEVALLNEKIKCLEEQLAWFKRQIFGQKADRVIEQRDEQLHFEFYDSLNTEKKEEKKIKVPDHERKQRQSTGKDKISFPEDLPVERHVLDIPDEDKICPETGKPLIKIGEEITSKLALKPGSYYIKQIVRPKYALPQGSEGGVVTAPLPEALFTRCQADESLLAEIVVKKFCDHLPLYRQSEIMAREKIKISRQVLCQWTLRVGKALKPLYDEMLSQVLQSNNIFYDETPIDMLDPGQGKVRQAYMWTIVGGQSANPGYRVYDFRTNRRHDNVFSMLRGYTGVLHSDKYGAYEAFAKKQKKVIWCPCWAHIRRKFVEAETGDPPFRQWVLREIKCLFMLEQEAWSRSEEERLQIRREKEAPIIDKLITAIKARQIDGQILPKSKFREALGYFTSLIPYLKNYIEHAWSRIDNNVAERAIKTIAIGRKNWLFVGNEVGGEAAATILTLVQSCRAIGINPREYLEDVMRRLMSHSAKKLKELLPDQWAAARGIVLTP